MRVGDAVAPEGGRGEVGAPSLKGGRLRSTWATVARAWEDLRVPVLVFLGMRVFLTLAVYLVAPHFPLPAREGTWSALPAYPMLDVGARWDSGWYASIAEAGYKYSSDRSSNVAFLPAYPLAIKALTFVTGNVWIAGILVSNLAYLGALVALYKLAQLKGGTSVARRAVLYAAAFPTAFFFYSMYSESLYLLSVVLAFYFWERRNDWGAGAMGAVAALTRPMGMLLLLAGAAFHLVERRKRRRTETRTGADTAQTVRYSLLTSRIFPLLLIPLAFAAFLGYSQVAFGEGLAFLQSRSMGWNEPLSLLPASHRELASSFLDGSVFRGNGPALRLLDAASALAFLVLTVAVFKRLGPAYGLYSAGSLAMPLVVNLDGLARYVSVIFPAFIVLASWRARTWLVAPLVGLSILLMGLMASLFARWYFVG